MDNDNECITFTFVSKKARDSRTFSYNHVDIRALIESHKQNKFIPEIKSENQKEIEGLCKRIRELEKESSNYKKDKSLRERYEKLLSENKELKNSLKKHISITNRIHLLLHKHLTRNRAIIN
ncbi:MAG TPA: hypothetical protein VKF38_12675 [Anaerolineaceae bacterium]|nr:hypothetical protein [Anaerolineaceae bacterium]